MSDFKWDAVRQRALIGVRENERFKETEVLAFWRGVVAVLDERNELLAAVDEARVLISVVVLGIVMGERPGPEAEAEVNRVMDVLNAAVKKARGG